MYKDKVQDGQRFDYSVTINPYSMKLADTDVFLEDTFDPGLIIDMSSIKVWYGKLKTSQKTKEGGLSTSDMSAIGDLDKDGEAIITQNSIKTDTNTLRIKLPDSSKPYIITYSAYAMKKNIDLNNSVKLVAGNSDTGTSAGQRTVSAKFTSSSWSSLRLPAALANQYVQVAIKKVDKNDSVITSGAEFGMYSDYACTNLITKATTDNMGTVTLVAHESAFGGTKPKYVYIKEITPPSGYKAAGVKVFDTTTASNGDDPDLTIKNYLESDSEEDSPDSNPNPDNPPADATVSLLKTDDNNSPLEGAIFEIYPTEDCTAGTAVGRETTGEDGKIKFVNLLRDKDYWVLEVEAPENYTKSDTKYKVHTTSDARDVEANNGKAIINQKQSSSNPPDGGDSGTGGGGSGTGGGDSGSGGGDSGTGGGGSGTGGGDSGTGGGDSGSGGGTGGGSGGGSTTPTPPPAPDTPPAGEPGDKPPVKDDKPVKDDDDDDDEDGGGGTPGTPAGTPGGTPTGTPGGTPGGGLTTPPGTGGTALGLGATPDPGLIDKLMESLGISTGTPIGTSGGDDTSAPIATISPAPGDPVRPTLTKAPAPGPGEPAETPPKPPAPGEESLLALPESPEGPLLGTTDAGKPILGGPLTGGVDPKDITEGIKKGELPPHYTPDPAATDKPVAPESDIYHPYYGYVTPDSVTEDGKLVVDGKELDSIAPYKVPRDAAEIAAYYGDLPDTAKPKDIIGKIPKSLPITSDGDLEQQRDGGIVGAVAMNDPDYFLDGFGIPHRRDDYTIPAYWRDAEGNMIGMLDEDGNWVWIFEDTPMGLLEFGAGTGDIMPVMMLVFSLCLLVTISVKLYLLLAGRRADRS